MAWTVGQEQAIKQRNSNILVSAAAGSGKTAVLTERVFQRVVGSETEAGIDIDRFLIVTFTSAAAQEMKERIAGKLSDAIEKLQEAGDASNLEERVQYLEKQLALIGKASISTIHAFCLKLVKNYFNQLGIDPNVKVGDESELHLMKLEIIEDLLEEAFETGEAAFMHLADTYGNVRGMEPLVALLLSVHTFSKSTVAPSQWLEAMSRQLDTTHQAVGDTLWDKALLEEMLETLTDLQRIYEQALLITRGVDGPGLYEDILQEEYTQLQDVWAYSQQAEYDVDTLLSKLRTVSFGRLPSKKQDCAPHLKEQVKGYRELAKKTVGAMQDQIRVMQDVTLRQKTCEAAKLMQALADLVETFDRRYSEAKKEQNTVDYNDLEHMCLTLLIDFEQSNIDTGELVYTDVARELAGFYEEIYIDEYQDSNMVQETLLGSIAQAKADGPTRFMVGDMKQSIYRFRLANPLIFADKYERFEKYVPAAEVACDERDTEQHDEAGQEAMQEERTSSQEVKEVCIDLSQNFRSRAIVLDATNDLFDQVMSKRVGELTYDEAARLRVGNHYDEVSVEGYEADIAQTVEVHLVEQDGETDEGDEDDALEDLKGIEREAQMVAQMIDDLVHGRGSVKVVYDKEKKAYRPVEPRDIVILLRSVRNKAPVFEEALLAKGVEAYADIAGNFFEASEVQMMLALLQIIDNPRQDIPLLTVLRSPMVRIDFDTLLTIRKYDEGGDFYTAMQRFIQDGMASEALLKFSGMLQTYREKSMLLSVEALINSLYSETGYLRYVSLLPTGAKKKANLKLLKDYAERFESGQGVGLFGFLQYMQKLEKTGADVREAKLVGESENLVQIMTIHKSKGLEFPIVFVCNTDKKFNNQDIMKDVLLHHTLGFGPKFVDQETNTLYETVPFYAIKSKMISENISEEMRVLYVALTRAKEKLYLTGSVKNFAAQLAKWHQFAVRNEKGILPLGLKQSPTYLSWIGMSLAAHQGFDTFRTLHGEAMDYLYAGEGKWTFKLWQPTALQTLETQLREVIETRKEQLKNWAYTVEDNAAKEAIAKRLDYSYPYESATTMPVKVSVSAIKKKAYESVQHTTQQERRRPRFMTETSQLTGAARGTLIHEVFEKIDFETFTTYEAIKEEMTALIQAGKLSEAVSEVIALDKCVAVAQSPILARMRQAQYVWKEKAFVYRAPATHVDPTYPETETILIQGIVDTCFVEADGLVLVDYKSDYIDVAHKASEIKRVIDQYGIQLDLYAEALSGITKKPVKEKWLYLYSINEWVCL